MNCSKKYGTKSYIACFMVTVELFLLQTLKQANMAKEDMRLVVIGVGDHVDRSELQQIASKESDVHYVGSYKELPQLADTVIESLCNGEYFDLDPRCMSIRTCLSHIRTAV